MAILTKQALNLIKSKGGAALYGKIADAIGVSGPTLKDMLIANDDERLGGTAVVTLIKNHLAELQDMQILLQTQQAA